MQDVMPVFLFGVEADGWPESTHDFFRLELSK